MSLTDGSENEGWERGSPRTQDLCLSPSRLWEGTTPSHLESEGSSQLTRDLGETQLAFSTAQLPQSSWVFPPLNTCPRFTFEVYILLCTTPTTTSLMRSTGAKSWRGHPSHPGATQIGPAKVLSALGLQYVLMLQCTSLLQAGLRVQIISQVGCKQQQ